MPTHIQHAQNEIAKIDSLATDGLSGTDNSLAYRIGEVERHFHSYERWYGLAGTPSGETHRADQVAKDIAPFRIDAGNDAYGAWVQIVGSSDTAQKFDLHRLMIVDVERDGAAHFIQVACGTSGDAAVTAGAYTEVVYKPQSTNTEETPVVIQMRRQAAGTKVWARCLSYDQDTGTIDFYFGMHYYEG
jgi:hypothetical protein